MCLLIVVQSCVHSKKEGWYLQPAAVWQITKVAPHLQKDWARYWSGVHCDEMQSSVSGDSHVIVWKNVATMKSVVLYLKELLNQEWFFKNSCFTVAGLSLNGLCSYFVNAVVYYCCHFTAKLYMEWLLKFQFVLDWAKRLLHSVYHVVRLIMQRILPTWEAFSCSFLTLIQLTTKFAVKLLLFLVRLFRGLLV